MPKSPTFATSGTETDKIDVRLSFRIVSLFSEGLYASPHKAIEELVANSFDAGALRVAVLLPTDFHDQGATIAVLDDGEGMDATGLKQHWLIGKSDKRDLVKLPRRRQQIGKFGIGKLASYVLSNRLSHISKKGGKYYSTSMNFQTVDDRGEEEVEPKTPIKISLRELTEDQAKEALKEWTATAAFQKCGFKLFGSAATKSWTFAILSDLKDKVHEIRRGRLEWVLRTALPLRDDFAIYLDGAKLQPSRAGKGRHKKWILGKDIRELPKPAPDEIEATENKNQPTDSETRFALEHKPLGRITGYVEVYRDLLTDSAKSSELGRSHGFFVYVRDRLINVEDDHFGIPPDELRHGTFGRVRVVVHMDGLDDYLQSDRERIRQTPVLNDAQNILRAIFNKIRPEVEKIITDETPGEKLARKLAGSPTSLARRPIIEMARAALEGKIRSRYIALPPAVTASERDKIVATLETRAETPDRFIAGIDFVYDATSSDGIAVYDAISGRLRVNGLHPFVGAFFDEFIGKTSGLPLEVFAMAEVLLESHLHQAGLNQAQMDGVMTVRDELLRNVAKESGRMTPLMVANALRNARNDQDQLEIWVVEAFRSLGFEATRIGGKGKPDGIAEALLAPDAKKQPQRYKVSLEAKSKQKAGAKVSAKTVGISTIARQRKDFDCQHAIVVGQLFPTTQKDTSALAKEIADDRKLTAAANNPRTITLMHIEDLANLVQHRPVKALTLQRIRQMLQNQSLPEDCKRWVDAVIAEKPVQHDYTTIVKTIARLQAGPRNEPVEYGELRAELRHGTPRIDYTDLAELRGVCERMAGLAPDDVEATARTVALNQGVPNILAKLQLATKEHLADSH
jgi:hypothetical protein